MGKKLESNFTNMVVVLFAISLIASAGVGYVYTLTKEPIAQAALAKQQEAISNFTLPNATENSSALPSRPSPTADSTVISKSWQASSLTEAFTTIPS